MRNGWFEVTRHNITIALFADEETAQSFTRDANTFRGSGIDYQCHRVDYTSDECPCCIPPPPESDR